MLTKITLNKIASYKTPTILNTDKKINLIYGLNGTGKSTLSNYLYKSSEAKYKDCSIDGLNDSELLVYNQSFIHDNFFETENLNGIFTLSKTNKDAETKVLNAQKEIKEYEIEKSGKENELRKTNEGLAEKQLVAKNKIWEIKTKYSGGDRVLEFCLEGYKSDRFKLLNHIISFKKPEIAPTKTVDELKEEVQALAGDNAQKYLPEIEELSTIINSVNKLIKEHNKKIDNKDDALNEIRKNFWQKMRWDYDHTITNFESERAAFHVNISAITIAIQSISKKVKKQEEIIVEQQRQTVNIEEAITSINNGLIELGIDEFKIEKYSDSLYKIARIDGEQKIFNSLSEGEKMIISFLYFLEQCRGKKNALDTGKKKIVVVDDPISSLSHIYVFNVGRLIHNELLRSNKYEQVFILTHSLYFFYELTDTNKERRKENQKLFRLRKNANGSEILEMSYEEVQNDYHSYWLIVKDDKQPPAFIANCMRNIIEYFYNFVEKQDLNNFFQKSELQDVRFQAFSRYINRESHSLGQNIFDYKEFNYADFKDAFALVFKVSGYEDHYKKMIK
jgi:wobble nucleotide-excising tRNase